MTDSRHQSQHLAAREVCDFCGHEQHKDDLRGKVILLCRDQAACLARAHRPAWQETESHA